MRGPGARMNLPAVLALTCVFHLERETAGTWLPTGTLWPAWCRPASSRWRISPPPSRNTSPCAASPDGAESDDDDPEALDEITYADGMLDLGEAAAEQLALTLDPYPRAPDAVLPDISDEPKGCRSARSRHCGAGTEALRSRSGGGR